MRKLRARTAQGHKAGKGCEGLELRPHDPLSYGGETSQAVQGELWASGHRLLCSARVACQVREG